MHQALCPFEKTILSTKFSCENAERAQFGERVAVLCRSHLAQANCTTVLGLMQEKARFVFRRKDTQGPLPFGQKMKVMQGGLMGLRGTVKADTRADAATRNVHALIVQAKQTYGTLHDLPYEKIVKSIASYQTTRRRSKRH